MHEWLITNLQRFVDLVFELLPQQIPDQRALTQCKIISHRGEHDNIDIIENTMTAFKQTANAGIWGLECDLRWTRDLVPVISHDPSGERLFNCPDQICDLEFDQLRNSLPEIPSLQELVDQFGGNVHLMIEIKDEHYPSPGKQKDILQQILEKLTPGKDYHFLALDPELFEKVDFISGKFHFPVAEINVSKLSKLSIDLNLGGITGHYLLLNKKLKNLHEANGQKIGTGFITSRNCLFRELNRGVEWIFSNHAVKIQQIRDSFLVE